MVCRIGVSSIKSSTYVRGTVAIASTVASIRQVPIVRSAGTTTIARQTVIGADLVVVTLSVSAMCRCEM